ncbi:putative methyltransferase NSUN5C [Pollicipes pollicipes]|uniref:putative methyltransferase NSUN5C n=1 Tax=Pollicipes pollicipes TaxID=41117 RepID=UPI00188529B5|nr:putative methyltransferase NSUN5C [Pollicipes pollicipes]
MKTSQLAAMMQNTGTLVAVERDQARFQTLSRMLRRAGVTNCRLICGDFLRLQPADHPQLTAILLDPSCSGTGMAGRESADSVSADRLQRLANLQGMLLRHALSFPAVRRVVYSTCSVTERENEQVVAATLAAQPCWRLAATAPASWPGRGRPSLSDGQHCLRASAEHDLCNGFFVATFVRAAENEARPGKHKVKTRKREPCDAETARATAETTTGKRAGGKTAKTVGSADGEGAPPPPKKRKRSKSTRESPVTGEDSRRGSNGTADEAGGPKNKASSITGKKKRAPKSNGVRGEAAAAVPRRPSEPAQCRSPERPVHSDPQMKTHAVSMKNVSGKRLSKRRRSLARKKAPGP